MLKTSDPNHPFNGGYRGETVRPPRKPNPEASRVRRTIEDIHEQRRIREQHEL